MKRFVRHLSIGLFGLAVAQSSQAAGPLQHDVVIRDQKYLTCFHDRLKLIGKSTNDRPIPFTGVCDRMGGALTEVFRQIPIPHHPKKSAQDPVNKPSPPPQLADFSLTGEQARCLSLRTPEKIEALAPFDFCMR